MSVRKRGNKWIAKAYDKSMPGDTRWIGSYDTKLEAREAEIAARRSMIPGSRARTVREWSVVWLRDYARPAPATRRTYRYAVDRIVQDIGDQRLDRIDRPTARRQAQAWPNAVGRVCRTMFADALRDGLTTMNPFTGLRLETPKGRKDLTALTEPEIQGLADAALPALGDYGPEFRAVILFLGYVGCRAGELCCLRRDDVDFASGEVLIQFSLDGMGGEKPPKNGKPRRVIVPPPALAALEDVPPRLDSPYLFHSRSGRRFSKGTLFYALKETRQRWGQRSVTPHELRHACATLLMERGVAPHVVAQQMGHEDGGWYVQTLYGHPRDQGMRDQVKLAFAGWGASTSRRETA